MSSQPRRYRLQARADRQRATRGRIVAATVALHGEVGPARTTIADIARRAGVQRLTVYNHFPDLAGLLMACQGSFLGESPPPELGPSQEPRLERALAALYDWYRSNQSMQRNVARDRHQVPELDALLRETADRRFRAAADSYAARLATRTSAVAAVRSLIQVAMAFETWDRLQAEGIPDQEAATLMTRAVKAVA